MANIVLTRIDDRLIHGQVMTSWVNYVSGNRIIIVDDAVAKDQFIQKVLIMAAPPTIKVEVYDVEKAAEILKEESEENERIIILVKYPQTIEKLIDKGVGIKKVIVGGMGAGPGRKRFYRNISLSEEEKITFSRLLDKGVKIDIRIVPDDKAKPISDLL